MTDNRDSLIDAVETLAQEVRVLRDVLDDLREEYRWITRNGLPIRPTEHFVVKQMALDPCAKDWGKRLKIERWSQIPKPLHPDDFDAISDFAAKFESIVHGIADAQLEVFLVALDGVREQILRTLGKPDGKTLHPMTTPKPDKSVHSESEIATAPEKPPPGRLF